VWYILGGNPHLAKEFARWIVDYDERFVGEGEEVSTILPTFTFSSDIITLDEHHGEDVKIGLREAMEYITAECDRETILQQSFIQDNMYLIKQLTEHTGNEPVRLFDFKLESTSTYTKKKKFDESTWDGEDYSDLAVAIIRCLVNHANHQQRCENYVQATGLISQTNIGEARPTIRTIIVSVIIRRFNAWGLKKLQSTPRLWKTAGKMPARLTGSNKTYLFLEYLDQYLKEVDVANEAIDQLDIAKGGKAGDTRRRIIAHLELQAGKISAAEGDAFVESVTAKYGDDVPQYVAEVGGEVDVPADMGGKVLLRIFTKTRDRFIKAVNNDLTMEKCVVAEIEARKISISEENLKSLSIAEKRKKIRKNEFDNISSERKGMAETDVKDFTPESLEMKYMIDKFHKVQEKIINFEKGIDDVEANL